MTRGLYFNSRHTTPRYLSVKEIATACRLSLQKVKNLISQGVLRPARNNQNLVDVGDVLWFLIHNKMTVATSLLPPKTGRILFIAATDRELQENDKTFDHLCTLFAEHHNLVLAESTSLEQAAHLSILTFSPNVVVILPGQHNFELGGTRDILAGLPGLKTILLSDTNAATASLQPLRTDLVISEKLPVEKLSRQLTAFFAT